MKKKRRSHRLARPSPEMMAAVQHNRKEKKESLLIQKKLQSCLPTHQRKSDFRMSGDHSQVQTEKGEDYERSESSSDDNAHNDDIENEKSAKRHALAHDGSTPTDIDDIPISLVSGDFDDDLLASSSIRMGGGCLRSNASSKNNLLQLPRDDEGDSGSHFSSNLDELRQEALRFNKD